MTEVCLALSELFPCLAGSIMCIYTSVTKKMLIRRDEGRILRWVDISMWARSYFTLAYGHAHVDDPPFPPDSRMERKVVKYSGLYRSVPHQVSLLLPLPARTIASYFYDLRTNMEVVAARRACSVSKATKRNKFKLASFKSLQFNVSPAVHEEQVFVISFIQTSS